MAEGSSYTDVIEEALHQFCHGSDTVSELAFLDSLGSAGSSVFDGEKSSSSGCIPNGQGVRLEKNVSVCDITISMSSADITSQEDSTTEKEENGRSHSQELCPSDEEGSCEVDLGCGDLGQAPWTSTRACSPHFSSTESPGGFSCPDRGKPSNSIPNPSHGKLAKSSDFQNALQPTMNLSACLLNIDLNYLCEDAILVEKFIKYVFVRRYGQADKQSDDSSPSDGLPDPQVVADVNRKLDTVIKRLMDQPVTVELADAYSRVLQNASGMPTVRKKMMEHVMVWFTRCKTSLDEPTFKHVKTLVLIGLSDVWSVVRKTCSTGVWRVFSDWSPRQQEDCFESFLEICIDKEGSWQSKDGAALCVHAIMFNCFAPSMQNKEAVTELPSYIVECVLTIVFSLISHPQLSIRETVTKIMSTYMQHVESQDMLDLMHQTLTLLTPPTANTESSETFHCVEAYAAEGLLNICTSIFKVLPVRKALHFWLTHCKAFLTYLSHDASSVRQTASTLCMHVATHRESIAVLMKLVMHHLTQAWPVNLQSLMACHCFLQATDVDDDRMTWEGKEGRMFVYELLCKHLIEFHTASADNQTGVSSQQNVCSQDGGSEMQESVEDVYRAIGGHLAGKSSLMQLFLLDNALHLADDTGFKIANEEELQNLQRWLLLHFLSLSHECGDGTPQCGDLRLPSSQELLMTMLHHTAVCLAHTQWELRRIAQQVLPCLCEVMCLYDAELIMSVWGYITEEASLLSFLGLYALHRSLALCARVVATADLTDKDLTIGNPIYVTFVDGVRKHVGDYLPLVCHHLQREAYDKMSVVAAETALLALNFFDLQEQIKKDLCSALVILWKNLFIFAHPQSAIATSLFPGLQHEFQSPYEGFLSCCLVRPESNVQCAKQVEKNLMLTIHKHLPHFLPQLDSSSAALCLPLLAHNIGLFIDDTDVCKSLINSFNTLCQCTRKSFASMASDMTTDVPGDQPLKCVYFAIRELTAVIALKNLDVALLQKILSCYLIVCESLQPELHIPLLLQSVAARMSDSGGFYVDAVDGEELDVALCWRRPELPPGFGQQPSHHNGDSLEQLNYTEETESDTSLNRSGSSLGQQMYSRSGRRRTLSTTDDILEIHEVVARLSARNKAEDGEEEVEEEEEEEEESDWDSWSEEGEPDQEHSALQTHFQDFFQQLRDIYGAEGKKMLKDGMLKLGESEQEVLKDLLKETAM